MKFFGRLYYSSIATKMFLKILKVLSKFSYKLNSSQAFGMEAAPPHRTHPGSYLIEYTSGPAQPYYLRGKISDKIETELKRRYKVLAWGLRRH